MDQPHPSHGQRSAARRRLIRGALAAPAVLTVCSGSAFAAASNMRCLANAVNDPFTANVVSSGDLDGLVRVSLWKKETGNEDNIKTEYWLRGSDLTDVAPGSELPESGKFWEFDITKNELVGDEKNNVANLEQSDRLAAVRFNANGEISGIGASGDGTALGNSCWHSFTGAL